MTTNEPPPPELCVVCGDPRNDHFRIHPFTSAGEDLPRQIFRPVRGGGEKNGVQLPFDPVLRQALLDKGILTPVELSAADEKVHAILSEAEDKAKEAQS